ncbi:Rieske 2Fe-2S domain-containing protein [Streptomyces noursei]|uniref:3-phenylpropionate dioxygenase n=1 Tax=Streptomyces noursei TaxID=1971 RepID=A0A2N8PJB8_STRNR|nr:Rieske 2Fe-2S domain-containing protein [Streptomyces noursei]PNE41134.1 3-phenylpropionate dioxygenase [Streptomyces noursei]
MALSTSATADHIYATGLRNQWHPVLPSSFVAPGAMRRVTVLGEQWLLFRRADGTLALLADRCPHRGAPLSLGKHLGDRVACRYHGVEVATDGTVASVPGLPGCALEGRRLVASLPVREVAGAVLAYFGDERHPEPVELTVPAPLDDPEIEPILCYAEWQAPWRYIMENLLDPMHGAFLHRESHTMYDGDTTAKFRVRETDRGYFFEKTDQRGVNFDWVELCRTGVDWVDLSIPYPPSAGPGGAFGIVGMVCPVDAERTGVFFWRYRRVSGWQRDTWRFLYRTLIEERHWAVLEQDRVLLEALPADADQHEHLYQHDLGLVRLRRLLRARAEQQSASAPPG